MDSNVQTKVPESRRTRYFIVGLLAVILVLSFQLYRVNNKKNDVVRRKTFLIGKLYDCRVAAEKSVTKYKNKQAENEQLTKELTAKQNANEVLTKKYNDLDASFQRRSEELQSLQAAADQSKVKLSKLNEDYDNAMSSVKTIQDKLNNTITVCKKHKENSQSLNQSIAERTRELVTCRQEKLSLEQEKRVESVKDLSRRMEEMEKIKRSLNMGGSEVGTSNLSGPGTNALQSQQASVAKKQTQSSHNLSQSVKDPVVLGKSSQDESSLFQSTLRQQIPIQSQVTPSTQQPVAGKTV